MSERRKAGAPPGGRVHWLQFELSGEFLRAYKMCNNYRSHNYRFYRMEKRTLVDEFLVVRTSKRCFRVTYYNEEYKFLMYFSSRNYCDCAKRMKEIYAIFKMIGGKSRQEGKKGEGLSIKTIPEKNNRNSS